MTEKRIRHLPVVDDGKLRGVHFHRRSGETHHLDPKRDDRASRELHLRRQVTSQRD